MHRVKFVAAVTAGIALMFAPVSSRGATLTGSSADLTAGTNFNLTALGTTDWFKIQGVDTNFHDATGSGFQISGEADGFDSLQPSSVSFSWTNGFGIPAATNTTGYVGVFAEFNHTDPLTITVNTTGTQEEAVIYGLQAEAVTLLTATLGNQTLTLTNPDDVTNGLDYSETGYTLDFKSDAPGQILKIVLTCEFDQGNFTGLMAGTLVAAPTPEPGAVAMMGMMGISLLRRRRQMPN